MSSKEIELKGVQDDLEKKRTSFEAARDELSAMQKKHNNEMLDMQRKHTDTEQKLTGTIAKLNAEIGNLTKKQADLATEIAREHDAEQKRAA